MLQVATMNEKAVGPSSSRTKPMPQGVYVMLPRNELPASHPLLGNDAFAGFRLFANWRDLQPSADLIDLSLITDAAQLVTQHGQKLLVSINFGKGAGEWIYGGQHPCTKFPFDMKGQPATMPLGFEEAYQRKVDDFLAQLAKRLDQEQAVAGFVMTGAGTLGIEFHVVQTSTDIENWEAAAQDAGFADKHAAIQACATYRIDRWAAQFKATTLLFCAGNPWSNQSGEQDEEAALEHAKSITNGGICTEFLRANSNYTDKGQVLDYPYAEEPVAPSSGNTFYLDIEQPYPAAPEPVHAILMTACNKGAAMCELWEEDALNPANHDTVAEDAQHLIDNVKK
jgi:hypothetical protein